MAIVSVFVSFVQDQCLEVTPIDTFDGSSVCDNAQLGSCLLVMLWDRESHQAEDTGGSF